MRWTNLSPFLAVLAVHVPCTRVPPAPGKASKTQAAVLPTFSDMTSVCDFFWSVLNFALVVWSTVNARKNHKHNLYLKHSTFRAVSSIFSDVSPSRPWNGAGSHWGPNKLDVRTGTLTSDQMVAVGIVNAGSSGWWTHDSVPVSSRDWPWVLDYQKLCVRINLGIHPEYSYD